MLQRNSLDAVIYFFDCFRYNVYQWFQLKLGKRNEIIIFESLLELVGFYEAAGAEAKHWPKRLMSNRQIKVVLSDSVIHKVTINKHFNMK